jgi:2,3-bisphosphoglycerate-dependent phosphoglycerate mutase
MNRFASLLALVLSTVLFAVAGGSDEGPQAKGGTAPRIVVLLRHAEKHPAGDSKDPGLSAAGAARATELARLLGKSGARALFASEYLRTRATLEPLAESLGLAIERVPARDVDALIAKLDAQPAGSRVIVAAHSNTLPVIASRLGVELDGLESGPGGPALPESQYDRILVVVRSDAGAELLELRGAP